MLFPPPASSKFHKTTTVNWDCQSPVTGLLNMPFTPLISSLQVHVNWLEKENTRQSTWSQRSQRVATYVGQEWEWVEWRAMWWSPLSLLSHLMVWRCVADLFTNTIIKHTIHFVVNEPHSQDQIRLLSAVIHEEHLDLCFYCYWSSSLTSTQLP